jgi:erythromycin esterase-like protein
VHVAALRLIPDVLRGAVDLAQASGRAGSESQRVYRETRDRLSARNVLRLHDAVSPGRRVLVWAHHSHVIHDTTGRNVESMGRSLLAAVPDRLYTIGLFAGSGAAATLRADGRSVSVTALPPPPHPSVERLLASLVRADYFVDLSRLERKSAAHAAWFAPLPSRQEPDDTLDTAVARDFHGAVFVREVHPPRMFLP